MCIHLFAVSQIPMNHKIFGGQSNDHGFDVVATSDGGYAMTGYSNSFTNGNYDVLLTKLDSNCNLQWSRVYGGTGSDQALQLVQTHDGGFVLAGKSTSFGAGDFDAILVRTDANGNLLWIKSYGGSTEERLLNLRETADHGFILAGSTYSFGMGNYDMLFIRTDSNGDTLWTKIFGGNNFDQGTDAEQTADGGFIFSGRVTGPGSALPDICLVKTNSAGDTLWTSIFGSTGWDEGMKVKQTYDGGYIVTGASTGFGGTGYDVYLNKTDGAGHLAWSKRYYGNHNDATYDVLQLPDSGFIITGVTESFGSNHLRKRHADTLVSKNTQPFPIQTLGSEHSNVLVIRTRANGDTLWTRTYGGQKMDEAFAIIQNPNHGFMIAAYSESYGSDSVDFLLVHFDSLGFSPCSVTPAGPSVTTPPTTEKNRFLQITSGLFVTTVTDTLSIPAATQHDACSTFVSITEPAVAKEEISIFPNPAYQQLTVSFELVQAIRQEVMSVYDATSREVYQSRVTSSEKIIDVSQWESGVYILQIGNFRKKIIKL